MLKEKSQHYNYSHEAIPTIFHSQTKDFFTFLERDGLKFLRFWWDHVGERLDNSKLSSFEGTHFEIREVPDRKSRIVLLRLPSPKEHGEFYMMALVQTPQRRLPMVRIPNTRVFALERVPAEKSASGTMMVEVTQRVRVVPVREGPSPTFATFYPLVVNTVWKKKKGG